MNDATSVFNRKSNRRKFLKNGMIAAGAATVGAGLLPEILFDLFESTKERENGDVTFGNGGPIVLFVVVTSER